MFESLLLGELEVASKIFGKSIRIAFVGEIVDVGVLQRIVGAQIFVVYII